MSTDDIYKVLREHLDKQAVGFPETESGVEIRILEELFTPEQANLALFMSYRPKSVAEIYRDAGDNCASLDIAQDLIEGMVDNGSIGVTEVEGVESYYLMPFLIGIIEQHAGKASPRFFVNYTRYFREGFGKSFIGTKVSQMRTIPVEKSIETEKIVATYDHIREFVKTSPGPFAISACICREGVKHRGETCKVTSRIETCMSLGDWARASIAKGGSREISREEALEILTKNQEEGLVLQPTNYQNPDFICSCCGCCCGVLSIEKNLPNPAEKWAHNYFAEIDSDLCTGCGMCETRCQMDAVMVGAGTGTAVIDLKRCFGCGNCVVACPSGALKLVKRADETAPPENRLGLYEILAEREE